jgi:outer membrane lipoprotein-sorting protein
MKNSLLVLCLFALGANLRAESVDAILARMDQTAPNFHAMTADVQMVTYTAILNDKTTEKGTLKMQRLKNNEMRAIIDFSGQTDARVIAFLGKIVRIYYPNLNSYQDFEVGKNTQVLNQYLLLGFGSSGKDLARSYDITPEGSEDVNGQTTTKLLLVPKDAKVKERLTKVEVWIPNGAAYPVQQQFYEPSGNYRKVTYSNIQLNPPMSGTLELKLPPGAKKQQSE